jgi:YcaO-like protein with predicted kinase domain
VTRAARGPTLSGRYDLRGTIRARPPAETLKTLAARLSHFGITRIARVTGLDTLGLPTSVSIRPNARHLSTSQGKGVSAELADISAVMESIEGWHAENARSPEVVDSYDRISRRHPAISPAGFLPGSRWTLASPGRSMGWVRGTDLRTQEPVWVPHAVTSLDSTVDHPDRALFRVSSNGLAAGNTPAEALCHALYEAVERDSDARWSALSERRRESTRVDPATVTVPFLRTILERIEGAGLVTLIWDMTSDLGIPAYRCILADRDPSRGLGWFRGSGAHLSSEVALSRAVTEAAQSRLTWIQGSREDLLPGHYREEAARAWRLPRERPPGRPFPARRSPYSGSALEEDLDWIVRRLSDAGYSRIVAVDHTRPELGIPVVLVLVPGLRFEEH